MSVTVVGVGADGWAGLGEPARAAVAAAGVVLGSGRQLGLLPGEVGARREAWPSPMMPALPGLVRRFADAGLVVLASGDPSFFGVGPAVARVCSDVRVLPSVSSVTLACARLGWASHDVDVLSAVARPVAALRPALAPGRRLLVLAEDAATAAHLAAVLVEAGYGDAELTVLARLGAPDEARWSATASSWAGPGDALSVLAVACPSRPDDPLLGRAPGLPDDAYAHDGQLTKAEVRVLTVAALRPYPGAVLWDVGGGAGSVGIEWMRHHPSCRAVSLEPRADRAARIAQNASRLGVPGLRVVTGRAPAALDGLDGAPDAVFVGGGVTVAGMLASCWSALRPGGRLVANAVTVEGEAALAGARSSYGGSLRRLSVDRAEPVGRFTGWRALAPVTQWVAVKAMGAVAPGIVEGDA